MKRKTVSGIMILLLTVGTLTLVFNIRSLKAGGTIYIRSDGSVEGTDKIQLDGDIYTFKGDINDSIVVQKDDIVVDGVGHTLEGTGNGTGIDLSGRRNVTIKHIVIREFEIAIMIHSSVNVIVSENTVLNNEYGVWLAQSSHNTVSGNNASKNGYGIYLHNCSDNIISKNYVKESIFIGIWIYVSSRNVICENNVVANSKGMSLWQCQGDKVYHNNLIENSARNDYSDADWDNGYPSGGNYWSDYNATDIYWGPNQNFKGRDTIADTSYQTEGYTPALDNYPLMMPWIAGKPSLTEFPDIDGDCYIGIKDLYRVASHFGESYP